MYESGHSEARAREEVRQALLRLESALAGHEARWHAHAGGACAEAREAMRRLLAMMGEEAERLRGLL